MPNRKKSLRRVLVMIWDHVPRHGQAPTLRVKPMCLYGCHLVWPYARVSGLYGSEEPAVIIIYRCQIWKPISKQHVDVQLELWWKCMG